MRGARVISFAIGIVVIAAFLNGLLLWRAAAEDFDSLDGTWEGDLKSVDLTGEGKATTSWRRIIIQDGQARVFYKRDEKINEAKPGKFRVERQLTNAVIVAIDSGHDSDGTWVENLGIRCHPKGQKYAHYEFHATSEQYQSAAIGRVQQILCFCNG